jgi:hypothetical protein
LVPRFEHRKNVVGDGLINVDPVRRAAFTSPATRRLLGLRL